MKKTKVKLSKNEAYMTMNMLSYADVSKKKDKKRVKKIINKILKKF